MLYPELFTTIVWISILNVVTVTLMVLLLAAVVITRGRRLARAHQKQEQV